MIKVLMFSPNDQDGVSYYRHWGPMLELERRDLVKLIAFPADSKQITNWQYFNKADCAFITRPARNHDYYFIKECEKWGLPVWVDVDDNVLAIQDDNPAYGYYSSDDAVKFHVTGLRSAKIITTATRRLHDFLKEKLALDSEIVPNGIDERFFRARRKFKLNKNVMWRGSMSKMADLIHFTGHFFKILKKPYNFKFFGLNPYFLRNYIEGSREFIYYDEPMNFVDYIIKIKEFEPSFNIVPMLPNEFNKTRSCNAWLEATCAGAITLAPSWREWLQPGIYNYTDENDFVLNFNAMLDTPEKILQNNWQASVNEINEKFLLNKINNKRLEILEKLISN